MENIFSTSLGVLVTMGTVLALVVGGVLYVLGLWKKGKDSEDDRLINILKETVETLEKRVTDQKKEHDDKLDTLTGEIRELRTKVGELEQENETLVKVLQGRDEQTAEFYKKAFKAMEVAEATHTIVSEMNKNNAELVRALVEHVKPGVTVNVPQGRN